MEQSITPAGQQRFAQIPGLSKHPDLSFALPVAWFDPGAFDAL